ncbi:hypothetical protein CDG76_15975 [Nostoc sp. 'Peltigera membranacea cyanobiont' 210A]|uniref:DUF4238 domain-containing protein n=1 Tax=Nostoc sp. 'Peltigera membranacea cyanobiont' 210A TaxID=2014529 RepID=UPI000B957EB4|nr:DUF4238 domain-containing protein [Nostoc sp. 'Peltigera membranacea cyanobiont' 210A]OYD94869.1 hypothetical protein CDG76_15975 [Nostoc sp. 'Peltigera membranacea cyanobiont' 210A]
MNKVKQQHFVPQFYLRNFANEDTLFVLDKIEKSIYQSHVKNVAQQRYFNDFPDSFLPEELKDKIKYQFMENDLAKVELRFGDFIKQIINCLEKIEENNLFDSLGVLDEEGKKKFSAFLALQLVRTTTPRGQIKEIFQSLDNLKKRMDRALFNNKIDIQKVSFPCPEPSSNSIYFDDLLKVGIEEDSIAQHLFYISNILDQGSDSEISKRLSSHIWLFGINSTSIPLWTSDNPIAIKQHEDFGTGLASHGVQVVYPITSKHLLIMFESNFWNKLNSYDRRSIFLSEEDVKSYNKLQANQCYRQTYSSEKNFELLLT